LSKNQHKMYLAPLNVDRFFKKVFSDVNIAKHFLEDFLDTKIETIELLTNRHKITDDATAVEFDFRCKINGQYTIVDMQQWYKTDVVKRFYLYHSLNTALQVRDIPEKTVAVGTSQKRDTPDYHYIEPVITLIWMAHDSMGFKDDFVTYILTPEVLSEFVKDTPIWQVENFAGLIEKREQVLVVMNNQSRQLDFLGKNKLIYAFQKNITVNKKYEKYVKWFEFAEKTSKKDNVEADFTEFEKYGVFIEIMKRINKTELKSEDFQYIEDYEKFQKQFEQHEQTIRKVALEEGEQKGVEKGIGIGIEIGIEKGIEKGDFNRKLIIAEKALKRGMSIEEVAEFVELPKEVVKALVEKLKN
jgi:hypothetical protein